MKKTDMHFQTPKKQRNYVKKPNEGHKNTMKEEILQVITENFMEMLLDMVNQNKQEGLKKFQDTKNKQNKKTQKQINEITGTQINTKLKQIHYK
jgi:hypothetical protein